MREVKQVFATCSAASRPWHTSTSTEGSYNELIHLQTTGVTFGLIENWTTWMRSPLIKLTFVPPSLFTYKKRIQYIKLRVKQTCKSLHYDDQQVVLQEMTWGRQQWFVDVSGSTKTPWRLCEEKLQRNWRQKELSYFEMQWFEIKHWIGHHLPIEWYSIHRVAGRELARQHKKATWPLLRSESISYTHAKLHYLEDESVGETLQAEQ